MNDLNDKSILQRYYTVIKNFIKEQQSLIFYQKNLIFPCLWSAVCNTNKLTFWLYKLLSSKFKIQKNRYNYFFHVYNYTWKNERAVEIPIIWEIISRYNNNEILEVGNVLSNYFPFVHDIIDKYEIADKVINQDIVDYDPDKKYNLIISISTIEHVGWNEIQKNPIKILEAINNLKNLLNKNGKIIITLPIGWNPYLDKLLNENRINFYKRI